MSRANVRTFEYLSQPYEQVREILRTDAAAILGPATKAAASRTAELAASLSVAIKGVEVSKAVTISIGAIREEEGPRRSPVTHGDAIDLAVGHRVAEAAVHRFVGAIVERLRQKSSPP